MRRTGPTNALARKLIRILRKQNKRIWKRVAEELRGPPGRGWSSTSRNR